MRQALTSEKRFLLIGVAVDCLRSLATVSYECWQAHGRGKADCCSKAHTLQSEIVSFTRIAYPGELGWKHRCGRAELSEGTVERFSWPLHRGCRSFSHRHIYWLPGQRHRKHDSGWRHAAGALGTRCPESCTCDAQGLYSRCTKNVCSPSCRLRRRCCRVLPGHDASYQRQLRRQPSGVLRPMWHNSATKSCPSAPAIAVRGSATAAI